MTPERYTRITNLCTAVAILSALLFDRVASLRVPVAIVGIGAAVAAMVVYFRRKEEKEPASWGQGEAVSATVRVEEIASPPVAERGTHASWYVYDTALTRDFGAEVVYDTTVAHDVAHHGAFQQLAQNNVLLFEPSVIEGLLGSSVISAGELRGQTDWGHVGDYELLITRDGLFAVRQARARKRHGVTVLRSMRHRDVESEDEEATALNFLSMAKTG